MNQHEGRMNHLKDNKKKRDVVKREKDLEEKRLEQNTTDVERFYKFLNHKSKTVFQVFSAISHAKTSVKPSSASKQSFISRGDINTLLQLCDKYKLKGVICLGINERPNEQTKITDILPKINDVLFDIDVRKEMKLNGISPDELKKEAKEVMEQCKIELEKLGFTVDLIVDSGNGYHIHIKVDLDVPNYSTKEEFEETEIYKRLVYLEKQLRDFNTKNVEIDFLSKDIVRRVKIAGTYNIKRYKDKDGKFKLMPQNQWRIAKILYLNDNINEKQNNTAFTNLPLDNETITKTEDFTNLFKHKTVNDLKRFGKLMEKDKKLKDLYNNELTSEYPSRSEAEIALITKLIQTKFDKSEINSIMDSCKIGKWNESPEAYKRATIKKASDYVSNLISNRQKIYRVETDDISAVVKESDDTVYEVVCNEDKIVHRRSKSFYNQQTEEIDVRTTDTIIINEPFCLENIYNNQNLELFYEVKIGNEIVCYNKRDLLNFIENERNYGFIAGRQLKECISVILREFEKVNELEHKKMYFTVGVFTDENDDLIVVHPDNKDIKVYGENSHQKRTIKWIIKKGLDMKGESLKDYFRLLHYDTFPEDVRLITFGHSLIANFFNVLRNDIDIFPAHWYITPVKGVGKTALFKLIYADLFGTKLKTGDDVGSLPRFTENCTNTTTCMFIDDVDELNKKTLNQMKTSATTLKPKERMTRDQKIIIQDTYRAFSGTANSEDFISGEKNEALRGRCLISRDFIIVDNFKELIELNEIKKRVLSNKIMGYFILTKSIEYINTVIEIDNISSYDKLVKIIDINKEKLRKYFGSKTVFDDPRRLTIYTLLYTSWQMWDFVFQEVGLHSKLLEDVLAYKENNKLLEYIRKYEGNLIQMNIDDVLNILEFYESIKDNNGKIRWENTDGNRILDTLFVNEYDKWAKIHGYYSLKRTTKLGEMLSKVLKKDMKPKTIKSRHIGSSPDAPCNKVVYGISFNDNEIYLKMGLKKFDGEMYDKIWNLFDDNDTDELELKNVIQILSLDYDKTKIRININSMIHLGKLEKIFEEDIVIIKRL